MAEAGAPSPITVSYYLQNRGALDAAGAVSIVDGAAHVAAHLDELNADPHVTTISLSGTGGNALTLTLAQALNDTHALAALAKPFSIAVVSSAGEALTASQIAQLSASGVTRAQGDRPICRSDGGAEAGARRGEAGRRTALRRLQRGSDALPAERPAGQRQLPWDRRSGLHVLYDHIWDGRETY